MRWDTIPWRSSAISESASRLIMFIFSNVIMNVPRLKYTEVYLDEGQIDMLAAMKAFVEVGYSNMIYPDHVPRIPGDEGSRIGWAYAVGHIKAIMRAAGVQA